jgi:alginate O-acetyltransferase complex protein AlgI
MDRSFWPVRAASVLATFLCVTVSLVFFRAADVRTALDVLAGMIGLHGGMLPWDYARIPGVWRIGTALGVAFGPVDPSLAPEFLFIALLLAIVWGLPNTQQWLRLFDTALDVGPTRGPAQTKGGLLDRLLVWRPTLAFGAIVGCIGFFSLMRALSAAPSEFLYFKF